MHIIEFLLTQQKDCESLEDLWAVFSKKVLSAASEFQKQSLKLAFFAGAGSLMFLLNREIVSNKADDRTAEQLAEALSAQLEKYIMETDRSKN